MRESVMRVLTLVMAGGRGSGLSLLSAARAKPAVPVAGHYRLIDFALSNIANSGLDRVAIVTQYQPQSLIRHIGDGAPWDLHRRPPRGVRFWQPDEHWYRGTADALYQNASAIAEEDADVLLIVCGDHVSRHDYRDLLRFHLAKRADLTISVTPVPTTDVHRFGIVTVDGDQRITSFAEKPKDSTSRLASMGIYVVNPRFLLTCLEEDAQNSSSAHELGHDIFPRLIGESAVFAYPFAGPWIDVGTLPVYWATNLAFLARPAPVHLSDPDWPIRTRLDEAYPPAWLAAGGEVRESLISPGCVIEGRVARSVLAPGVRVEAGASVRDSVLLHDVRVGGGAIVEQCVVDEEALIGARARVGGPWADNVVGSPAPVPTLVGRRARIPDNASIHPGARVNAARARDFLDLPGGVRASTRPE